MAKPEKQIRIVDVSGERIKRRDFGILQETLVLGSGNHPLEGENNPYCRFLIKLSSEVTSSWWSVFKEKSELAFPKTPMPTNWLIQVTETEESAKPVKVVREWEWRIYPDEHSANIIFAECSLNDLDVVLGKISPVISETQAKAKALEKLIQGRIAKIKAQKRLN